MNYRLAKVKST